MASAKERAETRKTNLNRILQNRFKGRIADMARALDRDDAYLWQLLNGDRNAGERIARHIEAKLALAEGSLDSPPGLVLEQAGSPYQTLGPREEMLLQLFAGLFSLQRRRLIINLQAAFEANQITRKELGQKPLRGVSDGQIEAAFGALPPPAPAAKKKKAAKREPGTAMDDFLGEPE